MDTDLFLILVGSVAVAGIARWRGWPAPLLVTVVALALAYVPAVPDIQINGELLLNLVLPPLLYSAALDVSYLNFRQSLPQIRRLGVWLVLLTTVAVGVVAFLIMPALTLPVALLLGAIVAPPDAVSAAAIGRRLGLPRRIMTVLSGESLINDATSLTLLRVFTLIVAGTTVTLFAGIWSFVVAVSVGVAIGLVFGFLLNLLRLRFNDPVVIGTVGLLVPFGAYAIAEHLQGSGVLAVVAMGLYVGYHAPRTSYTTRQQERPVWLSLDLLLESFVFALIGLQLPEVVSQLSQGSDSSIVQSILLAGAVLLVVLLVRPIFVFSSYAFAHWVERVKLRGLERKIANHGARRPRGRGRDGDESRRSKPEMPLEPVLSKRDRVVISWAGMRGVVTLAAAAAIPDLSGGAIPPVSQHAILFVAFVVTVGTLLLQGLTLPIMIRRLDVSGPEEQLEDEREIAAVRAKSNERGLAYLRERQAEWNARYGPEYAAKFERMAESLTRMSAEAERAQDAEESLELREEAAGELAPRPSADDMTDLARGWLDVRRAVVLDERDADNLNEEVMRELIVALDAEELALDTRGHAQPPPRAV